MPKMVKDLSLIFPTPRYKVPSKQLYYLGVQVCKPRGYDNIIGVGPTCQDVLALIVEISSICRTRLKKIV